jgi:hypothetical protein
MVFLEQIGKPSTLGLDLKTPRLWWQPIADRLAAISTTAIFQTSWPLIFPVIAGKPSPGLPCRPQIFGRIQTLTCFSFVPSFGYRRHLSVFRPEATGPSSGRDLLITIQLDPYGI